MYDVGRGYPATKGFDLASGLGTPVVTGPTGQPGLAADLCRALGGSAPPPAQVSVTTLFPDAGSVSGGTTVTVTGSGFGSGTLAGVDFGGRPASHVAIVSPTELIAKAPTAVQPPNTNGQAGGPANVTVSVRSGQGLSTSRPNAASVFDYVATSGHSDLPSVRGLGPYGGPVSGGNRVVVYGSGFVAGGPVSSVTFGGPRRRESSCAATQLTAIVPPRTAATSCRHAPASIPPPTARSRSWSPDCTARVPRRRYGRGTPGRRCRTGPGTSPRGRVRR